MLRVQGIVVAMKRSTSSAIAPSQQEDHMFEDRSKPAKPAEARIDLHEEVEVRDWAKAFGVRPEDLRRAVEAVGDGPVRVQRYLKSEAC
jgi:hypothetical protein